MSLVVTATDTEVGKTVVSAMILERYRSVGPLGYWKPLATGALDDRDRDHVSGWLGEGIDYLDEEYLYEPPVSPHLAARWADRPIDPDRVVARLRELRAERPDRPLVVEGIGGVLVPVTDDGDLLVELLARFELPCVVVTRSTLGTINHTLLTLEALRGRRVEIAGAVMVGPPNADNRDAIERFGRVEVIAEVPWLEPLDASTLRAAAGSIDPAGRLAPWLTAPSGDDTRRQA